jgi:hypothetical protein
VPTWKKSNPDHKAFNCSFEWHYRKQAIYLAVYGLLENITSGGKTSFFSSIQRVADYFDADYETVRRVFKQLVRTGWLKPATNAAGKRSGYFWVSHDEWEKSNPNQCTVRKLAIWQNEIDPLINKVYALCDGKIRLYEGHVAAMRKLATDEEILEQFRAEVMLAKHARANKQFSGTSPKSVWWNTFNYFKRRKAQNDQNSR